ncbi:zinc ribbon domain-containing protein [Pseudomonas sp. PA15(2017)]|uniref:zinc ribbon domain-containing protein n=1 Tax=Pseudomonas sp. PA15(2017) TaxID=1932111 RepID=UPI0015A75527|nr:zinc ribbon domain-containing protein [Pseudomonas sp. PA15(2017)]
MALIKCRECGNLVSTQAKACPTCGAKPKPKTSMITWLVLAVIIFFALKSCIIGSPTGTKPPAASRSDCSDTLAHVMATNFVKRQLKSPTSAKFPYTSDRDVSITKISDCRYQIHSYVDSQNGFGAMIRSRFSVIMDGLPDGKSWRAEQLVID